jgi:transposase
MRKGSSAAGITTMTAGLDLGDRSSQVCILDAAGQTVLEQRLATTAAALEEFFAGRARLRIALEAGTHSPWIARLLERAGHEVLVANPRRVRSISSNPRKSDRLDAEQLARLARHDPKLLAPIQHRSATAQQHLAVIHSRDLLVRTRTALAQHVRGTLKSLGIRLPRWSMDSFARRIGEQLPEAARAALRPVVLTLAHLTREIRAMEHELERLADEHYGVTRHLAAVKGVGTLTALAFVLVLADARRFKKSRDVPAYIGLTPRRRQSGDRDPQLRITKAGDTLLRRLLVGSAHYILGPFGEDCDLRDFGKRIAQHGGQAAKKRAAVAVARKLAVLLHHLWVTGAVYDPLYRRKRAATPAARAA